ncbi:IS110 family transposase [Candidatus Cryosericum septentrionale]|jgi:transposase|uniref:IS110 family transposase n=1 Tax=Candidatus Cryosericum septentrionale TaxID=2290913 RepID=A0A398DY70_9BACT|nr:IS110 family transposase [Candidatus Cryosericum septentrionale]RIE16284.1 IS110 family transposase [Candidatus Cryosericum septentrionale]
MTEYIGIDVSKQSLELWDGTQEEEVPNERRLTTLKKLLKKRYGGEWNQQVRFIYEPTGPYSNYLRVFASENELKVHEVNPKKSANFAKVLGNRSKTDAIDAKMLSAFHALLAEEDFCIPAMDERAEQLGAYLGSYEIIQKTRTMLSNHVHALEEKSGVTRKLKDSLEKELGRLGTMEEQLEKEMGAVAEDHEETREALHNLLSMNGIGIISAMSLLYLFRKYPGAHRNEITALAGLDPGQRQSGSSLQGGRKISRAGDPLLRKVLSLACMNSIQHNECIQAFYKHLVSDNHKKPKVALVACMRKLLFIAHHLYVTTSKYRALHHDANLCLSS